MPDEAAILTQLAALGLTGDDLVRAAEAPAAAWDGALAAADGPRCAADVVYWLDTYGWTYDPRDTAHPVKRFRPYPKQAEYLRWRRERQAVAAAGGDGGGAVDKCRDAGATWLMCADHLHNWLYVPNYAGGIGSRKLDLVDRKGDPDCIFEKIRFLLYHLPAWMLPKGFRPHEHDTEAKLINPANGATITGEGGEDIGRGGRKSLYDTDEDAFLKYPKKVEAALSATTRCRIRTSTHNGVGTMFYDYIQAGRGPVFVFDWRDDPRKNRTETLPDGRVVYPWYEGEKKRLDPVTLAQEVDRDPTASVEDIAIPGLWVRAAVGLDLPGFEDADCWAGFDVGGGTRPTSVLAVRRGPVVQPLQTFTGPNTTAVAWEVKESAEAKGVQSLAFEHTGVGTGPKGAWESAEESRRPAFEVRALNTGGPPTRNLWPDGRRACEKFLNVRAEAWWEVRERFRKTYEFVEQGVPHPPGELISIPRDPDLIAQLSGPKAARTEGGRIQVESKKRMRQRGVRSPDRADAVVLAFFEGCVSVYDSKDVLVLGAAHDDGPRPLTPPAPVGANLDEWWNDRGW